MTFNSSMCMRELKLPDTKKVKGKKLACPIKKIIDAHWKLFNLMSYC